MDDWMREFSEMMQAIADGVEQFFTEVSKDVEEAIGAIAEASEEFAEQMQTTFVTEVERHLDEFFDPILEAYLGFEIALDEAAQPVIHTIEPALNNHPTCVGCQHYHGQAYNGVMLVCGMHPYGWQEEKCPDWQSTWDE